MCENMPKNYGRYIGDKIKTFKDLIEDGFFDVNESDVKSILSRLQYGHQLEIAEWERLSDSFFVQIYNRFPEAFPDAVAIMAADYESSKKRARDLIELYKKNR